MTTNRRSFLGLAAGVAAGVTQSLPAAARSTATLYIGGYTSAAGGGRGIGLARYDALTGRIDSAGELAGVADPSFLIRSSSGRNLYAVNEGATGAVTALAIDGTGRLRVLNAQPTGGSAPCHLALADGHLLTANYGTGDVAVHPVRPDGSLGDRTDLVKHDGAEPHAHQVVAAGRFVLAVDLGTDSVYTYRLAAGKLELREQLRLAPGAGPRHLGFHPSGRSAYVANELDSTIAVCGYDPATGRLTVLTVLSTVPAGLPVRNYPAEVIVSADGRFVYLTNRGHNSIAVFAVQADGRLELLATPSCGGDWPRHLALDPSGRLLLVANQRSNSITTFHVAGGTLTPAAEPFGTPVPACVLPT